MISRRTLMLMLAAKATPSLAAPQDILQAIYDATNAARRQQHLHALSYNTRLASAAHAHANVMLRSGEFSHTAGGTQLTGRVRKTGYRFRRISENIAWLSRRSASDSDLARTLHQMWMGSAGHRRNILDARVSEIGIGIARSGPKVYAVQVFGRPS